MNLLREHRTEIADIFAGRGASDAQRRRAADRWLPMAGGAPGCRIVQARFCGSHYVIFGAVGDVYVAGQDAAPIYANRHYGRMAAQAA